MDRSVLSILIVISLLLAFSIASVTPRVEYTPTMAYRYRFNIDYDGNTYTLIRFESQESGISWVILPSYTNWTISISNGSIVEGVFKPLPDGSPFWGNYTFRFESNGKIFSMLIAYSIPLYTFIIEPNGFFLSPLIGFDRRARGSATIHMDGRISIGTAFYLSESLNVIRTVNPKKISIEDDRTIVEFDAISVSRIGFTFSRKGSPDTVSLVDPPFRMDIPSRYVDIGRRIMELYRDAYRILSSMLGIEFDNIVEVKLFVPTLQQFQEGVAGFVPISPGDLQSINLNLFNLRYISGTMELVALHELVHHFIKSIGISVDKLWIHEGLAEYISIKLASMLGYEDAAYSRYKQHMQTLQGIRSRSLSFIQGWSFVNKPADTRLLYAASFYIFHHIGEKYGGLEFYGRVFDIVRAMDGVKEDSILATSIGVVLGDISIGLSEFRRFGLTVVNTISLSATLSYLREATKSIPELLISKPILEALLRQMEELYARGLYATAESLTGLYQQLVKLPYTLTVSIYAILAMLALIGLSLKRRVEEYYS